MSKKVQFFKEPLFLFLAIGLLLFVFYELVSQKVARENKKIIVTESQIQFLEESFQKTWNRSPGEEELTAQINNYVMDEIFFREALKLGLEQSDPAVKLRLRQVMELMLDDYASIYPSEEQLREFMNENPDKFRRDPVISFRQLYFSEVDFDGAEQFLEALEKDKTMEEQYRGGLGMLPAYLTNEPKREVDRFFGYEFTEEVFSSESKEWFGPVRSAYGWHLVKIDALSSGELPELNEIWDDVEREWSVEWKKNIKELQYTALKKQYDIIIENTSSN